MFDFSTLENWGEQEDFFFNRNRLHMKTMILF